MTTVSKHSFTVSECLRPIKPPDEGEEGLGCFLLRLAMIVLVILSIMALAAAVCLPSVPGGQTLWIGIAIGLAVAAFVLFLIWLFLCPVKPCGWGWLFAWQILFGAGIALLYFALCCAYALLIGLVLIGLAIVPFILWIRQCRPSICRVAAEIGVVVSGFIIPAAAWLLKSPLAVCAPSWVAIAVGALGSLVTFVLARCAVAKP